MPSVIRRKPTFLNYLKEAFLFRWNLLVLGAGMAFGLVSPIPSVVCPLVLAAEVGYLAMLATNPRFQRAIDALYHRPVAVEQEKKLLMAVQRVNQLLAALSDQERQRFEQLQARCKRLGEIARGLETASDDFTIARMHSAGIDKLLWVFLRLLYARNAMQSFFQSTDRKEIEASMADIEARLDASCKKGNDPRLTKSIEDNLETSRTRLQNYDLVLGNFEFVGLELERIENKINAICEAALNRQDPDYITSQVDGVASSMAQTEKAMSQLQFLTGLREDEAVPTFIRETVDSSQ